MSVTDHPSACRTCAGSGWRWTNDGHGRQVDRLPTRRTDPRKCLRCFYEEGDDIDEGISGYQREQCVGEGGHIWDATKEAVMPRTIVDHLHEAAEHWNRLKEDGSQEFADNITAPTAQELRRANWGGSLIHLPAALAGEFPGLSRSHARRLIAQGHVRLNGQVVTDLDVDLDTIPGDPVNIEIARDLTSEALLGILEANQEAIDRCLTI